MNAITVIKAAAAASVVGGIDEKIKEQTFFIKSLTVDAESLMSSAKSDELRAEAKKVYEAIRSSDPMSDPRLADAEAEIRSQFSAFEDAVIADDAELAKANAQSLLSAVEKRNGKCKLFK